MQSHQLNQQDIESMITSTEIEIVIWNSQWAKVQDLMALWVGFIKHLKKSYHLSFWNSSKNFQWKKTPKLSLWGHHHSDNKTKIRYHKKENYRSISLMNIDVVSSIKSIMCHGQMGFTPGILGFFKICKSISVTDHIKKTEE